MKDAREMLRVLQEHSPETDTATASEPPPERIFPVGGDGRSRYRAHERRRKAVSRVEPWSKASLPHP